MSKIRLLYVVESGTDVRMCEGLAEKFSLLVLARKIIGGVEISHPPALPVSLKTGSPSRLKFALLAGLHIWRNRNEIDSVLVQGYGLAALASNVVGRLLGKPVWMLVCSPVEAYYRCRLTNPQPGKPFSKVELWGLQTLARINASLGQGYIVLSQHLREVVLSHGANVPIKKVPVYGVDLERFKPPIETKLSIKEKLGLPGTGKILFFSSRVVPEKDATTFLEACSLLLQQGEDIWILHRSGGYKQFLQQAALLGIQEKVIATDAVHPYRDLPFDYQASDVVVQASREEGLGFSVLEALACGIPVIATSVGGLQETIVPEITGWTYPLGNARALANGIQQVIHNPAEASRRVATGQKMVHADYEKSKVFSELEEVIRSR